jgi:hypothetical protein
MVDAPRVTSARGEIKLPQIVIKALTTQQRARASAYNVHQENTVNNTAWINQLEYARKASCAMEETRLLRVRDRATQKLATALWVL